MKVRKTLVGIGVAGSLLLTAAAAFAQYPGMPSGGYPGMGGGYPGMGGGYPGMPGGMPATGMGGTTTVTTNTTSTEGPSTLPKAGGDPLSVTAAGSLLLSGGYALRRKFRRA